MNKLLTEIEYENMNPVKGILLGDGNTSIMDVELDGLGRAGIAFKRVAGEVGADSGTGGNMLDKVDPDFIIVTDNVESLKVLADKVDRAINHLLNKANLSQSH